ncbi:MAG: serine/threonine protein kinase [Alkalinema sp. RL_2_19]|nr:serine/threonine protein kinase [Alkalinema sp. RL_2_19]
MTLVHSLTNYVERSLLPDLEIESISAVDPIVAHYIPEPWHLLGCGNYAAVVTHPDFPDLVVKVYAPDRPGIEAETQVYQRLGDHPAYATCEYVGPNYLILTRLQGITLYNCLHLGKRIPSQVIRDIDAALAYARSRGLFPHDVHGKNVMMLGNHGLVVDVSDFLHQEDCHAWRDLCWAYYWLYRPLFYPLGLRMPYWALDCLRASYRKSRRLLRLLTG